MGLRSEDEDGRPSPGELADMIIERNQLACAVIDFAELIKRIDPNADIDQITRVPAVKKALNNPRPTWVR